MKKLQFKKESIRVLGSRNLAEAAGGITTGGYTCTLPNRGCSTLEDTTPTRFAPLPRLRLMVIPLQ